MSRYGKILLAITLMDTFLTAIGINSGYLRECNPVILWLMTNAGLFLFVMFKAMFSLLVIVVLDRKLNSGDVDRGIVAVRSYKIAILSYGILCILYMGRILYLTHFS